MPHTKPHRFNKDRHEVRSEALPRHEALLRGQGDREGPYPTEQEGGLHYGHKEEGLAK